MDTPYYGTQIFGSKEQVVKPHTSVTLTCKSIVAEIKSLDSTRHDFKPKITTTKILTSEEGISGIVWSKNDVLLNEKVRV